MSSSLLFSILFTLAAGEAGPSDEMFEDLRTAPNTVEAEAMAEDILASLQESGSPTADLLLERAIAAENAQDFETSRAFLDRALIVKEDFAEAWFRRAMIFLIDEAYDQALQDINEALTHEPRHFRAWVVLGRILDQLGAEREALDAYRKALEIYPLYGPAQSEVRRLEPRVDGRSI